MPVPEDEDPMREFDPVFQKEPGTEEPEEAPNVWLRGLFMVIFAILLNLGGTLLGVLALVQFGWMLFAGEKNQHITRFGFSMGLWMASVAAFQTGQTDEKPFPWKRWEE